MLISYWIKKKKAFTVCLRGLDPFYIVFYYIKWIKSFEYKVMFIGNAIAVVGQYPIEFQFINLIVLIELSTNDML